MKPERLFGFRIGRVPAGTGYCRPWSHCHTRACPSGGGFASVATEATPVETCHRHVSKSRLSNPPPAFHQSKKDIPFGMSFRFGGRWWIRTTEVIDDRFTVCSLWPLGNPSTLGRQKQGHCNLFLSMRAESLPLVLQPANRKPYGFCWSW